MTVEYIGARSFVRERCVSELRSSNFTIVDLFTMNWEELESLLTGLSVKQDKTHYVVLEPYFDQSQSQLPYSVWLGRVKRCLPFSASVVRMGFFPDDWINHLRQANKFGYFLIPEASGQLRATSWRQFDDLLDRIDTSKRTRDEILLPVPPSRIRGLLGSNRKFLQLPREEYIEELSNFADRRTVTRLADYQALQSGKVFPHVESSNANPAADWLRDFKTLAHKEHSK